MATIDKEFAAVQRQMTVIVAGFGVGLLGILGALGAAQF